MRLQCHTPSNICLCVTVNIWGVRREPLRPISRSHTASTPLPSSIQKQQLRLWLQTREGTSEHNTETISNSPGVAASQVKSKVIFLSLFLCWSSTSANCTPKSSSKWLQCTLFFLGALAALGFLLTGFPRSSHSRIAAGLRVYPGSLNVLS